MVRVIIMEINSEKLLNELKRHKWNQERLAEAIKMSPGTISILLKRKTTTLATLNKIAKVFEMDAKDLLV